MRSVVVETSVDLASPPEEIWPLLTQTDRTNRLITEPVDFQPLEDPTTPARFLARTKVGGFNVVYEESPFEWRHNKEFRVFRKARTGLLEWIRYTWTLEKNGTAGTHAKLVIEVAPRIGVLRPVIWLKTRTLARRFADIAVEIDAHVRNGAPSPFRDPVSPVNHELLAAGIEELRRTGVRDKLAERIAKLLGEAPDGDIARIRPFEQADAWGEDRRAVLRAFLRAIPVGLFELRWGVVCPSCLTASEQYRALEEISLEGHCQLCDISFQLDLDRAVEALLVPHPSVRSVPDQLYCIGGPSRTPHVLEQAIVAPGETRELQAPAEPGRYRIFARGGASSTLEVGEDAPASAQVTVDTSGAHPARVELRPGGSVRITSRCKDARHVKIERLEYASTAATAHLVSTLGEFRTLFSSQLLKRGVSLKVARVAMLFSDLTGSTALYTQVGDASAFRLVDDHFDVLRRVVEKHRGVFVKTMGDAMLAAFTDTHECAAAALDSLEGFETFRAAQKNGDLIGLKLGMFGGPCYVVTANKQLDYFGQTVNVASRVQHLAESGQIVMSRADYEGLGDADRARLILVENFKARVKGVAEELDLVRLTLSKSTRAAAAALSLPE